MAGGPWLSHCSIGGQQLLLVGHDAAVVATVRVVVAAAALVVVVADLDVLAIDGTGHLELQMLPVFHSTLCADHIPFCNIQRCADNSCVNTVTKP